MKEHPILFSTEMVRAILEGRKTETRRIIKPKPDGDAPLYLEYCDKWYISTLQRESKFIKHRYGKPCDILWVRETWNKYDSKEVPFVYKATDLRSCGHTWKPSIHMPKKAARIWLLNKGVHVEKLQDITEESAINEGVGAGFQLNAGWPDYTRIKNGICEVTQDTAHMSFATLIDSINGQGTWDKNPWVWVIKFKVLSTTSRPENI